MWFNNELRHSSSSAFVYSLGDENFPLRLVGFRNDRATEPDSEKVVIKFAKQTFNS